MRFPSAVKKEYLVFVFFAILIFAFYGNTLRNGFIHDDIAQIVDNEYVHSLKYLPKVLTGCPWEHEFTGCKGLIYYRPLQNLSYLLTYQISSAAWFFHLINLVYFLLAVSLVFIFVKTISESSVVASLSALIFLIHPINSEAVNWIAAAPEILYAIFVLLAVIFYFRYRQSGLEKNLYLTFLFFFLGLLSKEPAVFLPIIVLFIDWAFYDIKIKEIFSEKELKKYLIFAGLFFIYFLMRESVLGNFGGLLTGGKYYGAFTLSERVFAFFTLFTQYLKMMFWPNPLLFFYPFEKSSNFLSSQFFASFFITIIFFLALYLFLKIKNRVIVLSLIWFFVFISPAVMFLNKVGENIFSERYIFASTIGFSLIVSYFLNYLWQKNKFFKITIFLVMISVTVLSWQIVNSRNKDWKDNETIYTLTLSQNPKAGPIRYNLAAEYHKNGNLELAEKEYNELIEKNPGWVEIYKAYNNLGEIYRVKKEIDKAIEYYQKSIEVSEGQKPDAYNNLAGLYAEKGEYLNSLLSICKVLQLAPSEDAQFNFERIISMVKSERDKEEGYVRLYLEIMASMSFKKSEEEKIIFKEKSCEGKTCVYAFSPHELQEKEIVFTFLILANASEKGIVEIKNSSYNNQTGQILVEIDSQYKDNALNFIFPTCDKIYYQVSVAPDD